MFKNHPDPMRMETTPERVYAVCKMIEKQPMTKEDLVKTMSLGIEHADIGRSVEVALQELNLLKLHDGYLSVSVPSDKLASPIAFRRMVSSIVFQKQESTFFMFTKWLIEQNETLFPLDKWEVMATTATTQVPNLNGINENGILGWRFWAAFLGVGYLSGSMIIPNMKTRIQDVLASNMDEWCGDNSSLRAQDFISRIEGKIPEVDFHGDCLPLAFSAGLRTLNALDFVNLETKRDTDVVRLYRVDGEPINEFSHISIKMEVFQ